MSGTVKIIALLALVTAASLPGVAATNTVELSSGKQQVALIELFTSEGCSSCPPADRWLSKLKTDRGLWTRFVPIAFHVDYWDYIGWKDEFARPEFSDRQRQYADEGGARFVYTPGVFQNGAEWHGWRRERTVGGERPDVGDLQLAINAGQVTARFQPIAQADRKLTVHIALLGMAIESRVRAGENTGKTLHHDFVAWHTFAVPLVRMADAYTANAQLPVTNNKTGQQAVVAWVSGDNEQTPIQSVGGYLPAR